MVQEFLGRLSSCPVVNFQSRQVSSAGDQDRKSSLSEIGGSRGGAFSSQLEEELFAGRIDVAVHSLKDLPTAMPDALSLATTPPREDIHDALCGSTLAGLRKGAKVGTGAVRRIAQLKAVRPDLDIVPIRGNVPPRLAKLKNGFDAVVLSASGLRRLGLEDKITELLPLEQFPPSPGQGAMGIQVRRSDTELLAMLNEFGDPVADVTVRAERALLAELHGGCSVPIGAYALLGPDGSTLTLTGQVTSVDGSRQINGTVEGTNPEELGKTLAEILLQRGAESILQEIRTPV